MFTSFPDPYDVGNTCPECYHRDIKNPMKCYHYYPDDTRFILDMKEEYPEWVADHPEFLKRDVKAIYDLHHETERAREAARIANKALGARRPIKVYLTAGQKKEIKRLKKEESSKAEMLEALSPQPPLGEDSTLIDIPSDPIRTYPPPPSGVESSSRKLPKVVNRFPKSLRNFVGGYQTDMLSKSPFPIIQDRRGSSFVVAYKDMIRFLTVVGEALQHGDPFSLRLNRLLGACAASAEHTKYEVCDDAFVRASTHTTRTVFQRLRIAATG